MPRQRAPKTRPQYLHEFRGSAFDRNFDYRQAEHTLLSDASGVFPPSRSSSLEVHASSTCQLGCQSPEVQYDIIGLPDIPIYEPAGNSRLPGPDIPTPLSHEGWVFLHNQTYPRDSDNDTRASRWFLVPPILSASQAVSPPRFNANISSLCSERSFTSGHSSRVHDHIPVYNLDSPFSSPSIPPYEAQGLPAYSSLNAESQLALSSMPPLENFSSDGTQLPQLLSLIYPPCWLSEEGLLIVPSVPRVPIDNDETPTKANNNRNTPQAASSQSKSERSSVRGVILDDDTVILSPHVTQHRKGRCPKRQRCPSYNDSDIIP
ncbi:hypothetical protein BGW36DRAFT_444319 [Talaromyces proteolyticus]|uniref:Uncharacterized protein n=1 Tax=Talaromyces proteolyticus TaxID=1131652 RepID=A0AAD4Q550_9EURO|nr:uncharacterized protein BGW36DRAFT_444319 [Talaromyces proteolyticus]KAH8703804.1 hypothetical protein BGW36DRAFT_444319 [Talaromyces proteolyticus]